MLYFLNMFHSLIKMHEFVTTISLLDEDKLHILYSKGNPKTANDYGLDQPLDTIDFNPLFFGEDY